MEFGAYSKTASCSKDLRFKGAEMSRAEEKSLSEALASRQLIQYKKAGSTWIHELNLSHSMVMSMAKKEGKPWNLAKQVGKCLCFRNCT